MHHRKIPAIAGGIGQPVIAIRGGFIEPPADPYGYALDDEAFVLTGTGAQEVMRQVGNTDSARQAGLDLHGLRRYSAILKSHKKALLRRHKLHIAHFRTSAKAHSLRK